jgi:hypothetical protein
MDSTNQPSQSSQGSSLTQEKVNRNVVYYSLQSKEPNWSDDNDESIYESTLEDVKYRQRELARASKQTADRPFLPRSYVESKNRERKTEAYKHTVIRLSIQNLCVIQANFLSNEPVSNLFRFVNQDLLDGKFDTEFKLYFVRQRLQDASLTTLLDAGVSPMAVLIMELATPYIFIQKMKDKLKEVQLKDADLMSREWLTVNTNFELFENTVNGTEERLNGANAAAKRIAGLMSGKKTEASTSSTSSAQPKNDSTTTSAQPKDDSTTTNYSRPASTPKSQYPKWFKGSK